MSYSIKKVWLGNATEGSNVTLSLESIHAIEAPLEGKFSIFIDQRRFPTTPVDAPKHHVIVLGHFDNDDLQMIRDTINAYLSST